jgi:arginyl-tRNA synthetase
VKSRITQLVDSALANLPALNELPEASSTRASVERTRDSLHGDFASNIAMRLARSARKNPRELAATIIDALPTSDIIDKVEIAGPGFINFTVSSAAFQQAVAEIIEAGDTYGRQAKKEQPKILLEFVSANPTGPLHVGHGRHAAYGASLGNILKAAGYSVRSEYYVNDAGRQMDILGVSVLLRWLELGGQAVSIPDAGYKGDYILGIAAQVDTSELPETGIQELLEGLPADGPEGDKEEYIGALIKNAERIVGADKFDALRRQSLEMIRADIEDDLAEFGVHYDRWFSEDSLNDDNRIDDALAILEKRGELFKKDGATWFQASKYGDEKDRVVTRENGKKTYFASDIAYHYDKHRRGFNHLLDILGSDHHGYIARVKAGLVAMGYAGESLEVELVQFVSLYRGGKKLAMSTRSGEFVTLRQLREEVGNDAARFFYVMRSNDQHLDFDLELAKSRSNDNPVYYIQYAHARVASVFRQLEEKSLAYDEADGLASLGTLDETHERSLMSMLTRYPEIIELAANNRAPQHMVHYLRDLANEFHTYYNAHTFIVDDATSRNARLTLISATRNVIACGLKMLGVSAPESM